MTCPLAHPIPLSNLNVRAGGIYSAAQGKGTYLCAPCDSTGLTV